jgi:PAS domain S-box-containing protein
LPETAAQGFVALLDNVFRTGETFFGTELLLRIEQADSQQTKDVYFTFTYQAYQENGTTAGVSIFAYDVTTQVLARQQREAQQRQLRELFEQAPVAIFVLRGPDFVLEVVNPPMEELLGHPSAKLVGKPYFEAVPELAAQGYKELLEEVWRTGLPHVSQERPARFSRHLPGETGYFNFVYHPLRDTDDHVTGIMCVATDVSEQVKARKQVQLLNQELQATNVELGGTNEQLTRTNIDLDNFIYTASHDLKAPIANIEGLLNMLQRELPLQSQTGEVASILAMMQGSIDRFTRTIVHLTDVSKLQKEHTQAAEQVALAPVIEDVRLDLAHLLQQVNGRLSVDVRAAPTVMFSEKNLRSVIYNLLSNAIKYYHPDRAPDVRILGRLEEKYHVLEVKDNGLGLDLTREQDLFAMFRRYHTHVEGSGIGLYMVKRMVENAGGQIEVESQVGVGSTFSVYFKR